MSSLICLSTLKPLRTIHMWRPQNFGISGPPPSPYSTFHATCQCCLSAKFGDFLTSPPLSADVLCKCPLIPFTSSRHFWFCLYNQAWAEHVNRIQSCHELFLRPLEYEVEGDFGGFQISLPLLSARLIERKVISTMRNPNRTFKSSLRLGNGIPARKRIGHGAS